MTGDDGRRRIPSPLGALKNWWAKRSASQRAAEIASRVAASTAAKMLAGLVATTTVVASVASIPDTLDGPDLPAASEARLAAVDIAGLEQESERLRAALGAVQGDLVGLLEQMDDVDVPDVTSILEDVAAAEATLAGLRERVTAVQGQLDGSTFDVLSEVDDLAVRLDAVATSVAAARSEAEEASRLADQVVDELADRLDVLDSEVIAQGDDLAATAARVDALAADVADLATSLADTQTDVAGLLSRVSELESSLEEVDTRTDQLEALTTEAVYAGFTPPTLDGQNRGVGPTFSTRAESLVTVAVRSSAGGELPAATIHVVRTDAPWSGTDWSESAPTVGTAVHVALLPVGEWRIEVECDQACDLSTGSVVVQPSGTFTPIP